jgi:uncharacterized BrkB/YihY/UPF0761 family membrane protein
MILFDLHFSFATPLVFILALALHIFADFNLQGLLGHFKIKTWWIKECHSTELYLKYKYDYIISGIIHAFFWSCFTFLPILYLTLYDVFERIEIPFIGNMPIFVLAIIGIIIVNTGIHYFIDDLKANKRKINLWQDQLTHVAQIGLTIWFIIFCIRLGWM